MMWLTLKIQNERENVSFERKRHKSTIVEWVNFLPFYGTNFYSIRSKYKKHTINHAKRKGENT